MAHEGHRRGVVAIAERSFDDDLRQRDGTHPMADGAVARRLALQDVMAGTSPTPVPTSAHRPT